MRYKIEEGVYNCWTIKILCSDAHGNVCREKLLIFTDNPPKESLIWPPEELLAMQECFEWFAKDNGNNDAANCLSAFWETIERNASM